MHFPTSHNFLTSGEISIEEIIPLLGCESETLREEGWRNKANTQCLHSAAIIPSFISLDTKWFILSSESIRVSWIISQFLWVGGCFETGRGLIKSTQFLGFCSKRRFDPNRQQIICRRDAIKRWSVKASFQSCQQDQIHFSWFFILVWAMISAISQWNSYVCQDI